MLLKDSRVQGVKDSSELKRIRHKTGGYILNHKILFGKYPEERCPHIAKKLLS
jgi:hypothetical protein